MRPNAKHERLAQLLADGLPQHEAYTRAGFRAAEPRSAATKLLQRNGSIRQRVAAILAEREKIHGQATAAAVNKVALTKEWLLNELIEVVGMAKSAVPVLNNKGEPTGEYQTNLAAANRAIELLGRELGLFTEKKEIRTGPLDNLNHDQSKLVRDVLVEARAVITRAAGRSPTRVAG